MKQIKFQYKNSCFIKSELLKSLLNQLRPEITKIQSKLNLGYNSKYAFKYLPFDEISLKNIQNLVYQKQNLNPKTLIVIGIGGSNLGTWAVHEAINGKLYNEYPIFKKNKIKKVYFADTLDSDYINRISSLIKYELQNNRNVLINVISKSGTTIETVALFEHFLQILKIHKPLDYNDFIVVTTDSSSKLYNYAKTIKCSILTIPDNVGGRFSVFSAVGLFPLAMLSINIAELLQGAQNCNLDDAAISASILFYKYKNGINIHETFLFSVDLESLGKWYRQLLSESIGKKFDINKKIKNIGITPTVSIGSIDLHSLLQLNLGGPKDKFTTFVTVENNNTNLKVPDFKEFENLISNIQKLPFNQLMNAIIKGTQISYLKNERPFCNIILNNKTEYSIGQFMQFKMYEIVYLAYLLEIDPFDQPNAQDYKIETKKILDNKFYY